MVTAIFGLSQHSSREAENDPFSPDLRALDLAIAATAAEAKEAAVVFQRLDLVDELLDRLALLVLLRAERLDARGASTPTRLAAPISLAAPHPRSRPPIRTQSTGYSDRGRSDRSFPLAAALDGAPSHSPDTQRYPFACISYARVYPILY